MMIHPRPEIWSRSGWLLILLLGGCLTPWGVDVRKVPQDTLFHKNRANVLSSGDPSSRTLQVLRRYDLEDRFDRDPLAVLHVMDELVRRHPDPEAVFALAELCYVSARKQERLSRKMALRLYLGTAVYAYYYLFDPQVATVTNEYDPHFRLSCDLYNRSLAKCIELTQKKQLLRDDVLQLEFVKGSIDIRVERNGFLWDSEDFGSYLFANDYEVQGLSNQYQTFGLGVPLIAIRPKPRGSEGADKYFGNEQSFPVTAFLRMNSDIFNAERRGPIATLELHDPLRTQSVLVNGRVVPLESNLTAPLGYFLSRAKLEKIELASLLRAESVEDRSGLYLVQPYERGKIPVVFVHGLWSSPLAWMQMFNDLQGDPAIRDRYQFWFMLYPTGNPFLYSAAQMRQTLNEARQTFDPAGTDPALSEMVLVGHSMGGLISKTMVQSSGDAVWECLATKPIDQLNVSAEIRDRARGVFYFEPQPFVRRVVFIATPHQGSGLSKKPIGRITTKLITLPVNLLKGHDALVKADPDAFKPFFRDGLPTSIENLATNSPIIQALASRPIEPTVPYHSIIAQTRDDVPKEAGTDGVVSYWSSHLDGAVSEYLMPSVHACQTHPLAVLEVRRILLEHLASVGQQAEVLPPSTTSILEPAPIGPLRVLPPIQPALRQTAP